jgi:hypothetical protein
MSVFSYGEAVVPDQIPYWYSPNRRPRSILPVASFVLGIVACLVWVSPIIGLSVSLCGFVLGLKSRSYERGGFAIAGIVFSGIGFALSLIFAAIGVAFTWK